MPSATERWSERKINAKSGVRSFDVLSSAVGGNLQAAVDLVASSFVCRINDPHPWNGALRVTDDGPTADNTPGFTVIRVTVNYQLGSSSDPGPFGPLKIRWGFGSESVETDVDVEGNPIVDTAGFPFSRFLTRSDTIIQLDVLQQILPAAYDAAQAVEYANTVNNDGLSLFGYGTVDPGQVKCVSICPAEEYAPSVATNITKVSRFEIKRGTKQDPDGLWDAWRYRILSQGNNGWQYGSGGPSSKTGEFWRGGLKTTNVMLDENGKPYDSFVTVVGQPADNNPNAPQPPANLMEITANAVFLKYRKCLPKPFGSLGIF